MLKLVQHKQVSSYRCPATNDNLRKRHNPIPLRWRHNEHDCVSNDQPHDRVLNRLFRRRSKKTSKLRVTGLCEGNSPMTGEFPAQRARNAENVSIRWRHRDRSNSRLMRQSPNLTLNCAKMGKVMWAPGDYFSEIDILITKLNKEISWCIIDIWMKPWCLKIHQTNKYFTSHKSDIIVQCHVTKMMMEIFNSANHGD